MKSSTKNKIKIKCFWFFLNWMYVMDVELLRTKFNKKKSIFSTAITKSVITSDHCSLNKIQLPYPQIKFRAFVKINKISSNKQLLKFLNAIISLKLYVCIFYYYKKRKFSSSIYLFFDRTNWENVRKTIVNFRSKYWIAQVNC